MKLCYYSIKVKILSNYLHLELFHVTLSSEMTSLLDQKYEFNISYSISIDLNEFLVKNWTTKIKIIKEVNFIQECFTNFFYDERKKIYIMCSSIGKLYLYNDNGRILQIIENIFNQSIPVMGITQIANEASKYIIIYSNSNTVLIDILDNKEAKQSIIYESKLKNYFSSQKNFIYSEDLNKLFFENEEENYICYSLNSKKKYEMLKVK